MSNNDLGKTQKLNVYLLKEDTIDFNSAIKISELDYKQYEIKQSIEYDGTIIVGRTKESTTDWRQLLQQGTDGQLEDLQNASNRAVLFFKIEGRIFALPFGFGKSMLKDSVIEREFGLRTALNLMDYDKFLSIDKANISDLTVLTRTQSSNKADTSNFNIDIISDLLRGITGGLISENNDLGNLVTGSDSVNILPKIFFKNIPPILKKLKASYESDRYKERFDWIDKLKELKDKAVIETLKSTLIEKLKARDSSGIHLAPPFIIDWETFEGFAFTSIKADLETDLDISKYYEYKGDSIEQLDWDNLQAQHLYFKFSNYDYRTPFKLWRFLNFETKIDDEIYVFSLGKWYQISKNYIEEIRDYVADIEESDIDYPICPKDVSEGDYNLLLAGTSVDLALFDKELVKSEFMNRSNIELCDVLCLSKKELIHIKIRYSSATLSHLFAQGRVSSISLLRDKSFRKNCRNKIAAMLLDRDIIPLDNFKPSEYTITYALLDTETRSFIDSLPFFSLINFRLTLEGLKLFGFKVKVKNIKKLK